MCRRLLSAGLDSSLAGHGCSTTHVVMYVVVSHECDRGRRFTMRRYGVSFSACSRISNSASAACENVPPRSSTFTHAGTKMMLADEFTVDGWTDLLLVQSNVCDLRHWVIRATVLESVLQHIYTQSCAVPSTSFAFVTPCSERLDMSAMCWHMSVYVLVDTDGGWYDRRRIR